jgi:hypothetical protein
VIVYFDKRDWLVLQLEPDELTTLAQCDYANERAKACEDYVHDYLCCNDEWDWLSSDDTGDLISRDAPMFGFTLRTDAGDITKILGRWAWMSYQVIDLYGELARGKRCVLEGGFCEEGHGDLVQYYQGKFSKPEGVA